MGSYKLYGILQTLSVHKLLEIFAYIENFLEYLDYYVPLQSEIKNHYWLFRSIPTIWINHYLDNI